MAARRTGGLGRGLDALIPSKAKSEGPAASESKSAARDVKEKKSEKSADVPDKKKEKETESLSSERMVKISKIEPNRSQPRKVFNEDTLIELSESIKQYGVLEPLLVSDKKDYYEIIAGERRWRAAKLAGLKEVPVIIREFSDQEVFEISLIENLQRDDLNPIEEAKAYKRLMEEYDLKQDEIGERVSKSRTAITNSMRLLKLDDSVQQMLIDEMISTGHARALLPLPAEVQVDIANRVFDEKLSVRETEKLVRSLIEPKKEKPQKSIDLGEEALYESLQEKMKGIFGTKVSISRKKNNKGKIEIEYYSKDELERIIDLINSISY